MEVNTDTGLRIDGLHAKEPQHAWIRTPDGLPRGVGAQSILKIAIFYWGCVTAEVAWCTRRIPSLFIKLRSVFG